MLSPASTRNYGCSMTMLTCKGELTCSKQIRFSMMAPMEIVNTSELHVYERALYKMPERRPQPSGVLDPRLGVSNKRATCETCGQMLAECTGHFGYVALELPVFHIGYFRSTLQILQCICKACARVLLNDDERRVHVRRFRSQRTERVGREAAFRRVLDRCKRVKTCPHCGEANGAVKKTTQNLKIVHDPFGKSPPGLAAAARYHAEFDKASADNDQIRQHVKNVGDDLNPLRVLGLFSAIPDEDWELLDLAGRPEHLLMTHVPVPPVCIRPSVEMDAGAGSNEDDLTMKLMQIVEVNNILRQGLGKGLPIQNLAENWDFLQVGAGGGRACLLSLAGWPCAAACDAMRAMRCDAIRCRACGAPGPAALTPRRGALRPPSPFPAGAVRDVYQLGPARGDLDVPGAGQAHARLRAAAQGQAGPLPRQPVGQARRLLGAHGHHAGPKPGRGRGGWGPSAKVPSQTGPFSVAPSPLGPSLRRSRPSLLPWPPARLPCRFPTFFRSRAGGARVLQYCIMHCITLEPDPAQVGVPQLMATTLTYPERVTEASIEKLRQRVLAGSSAWPGANFVVFPSGDKVFLKFGDRRRIAAELRVGDVVERHLEGEPPPAASRAPALSLLRKPDVPRGFGVQGIPKP